MRVSRILIVLAVGFFLIFASLFPILLPAQSTKEEEPSPEEMEMFDEMMVKMMESMLNGMLNIMAKRESADKMATFSKNYYDALIAKGFSKDAALQIVISTGIPSIPSSR